MTARTKSSIKVVGAGLLGSSIGLGLGALGIKVWLADISGSTLDLAIDYGAGDKFTSGQSPEPDLVIVAVPPAMTASVILEQLQMHPNALVTDVASVKHQILQDVQEDSPEVGRYLGSHPMAGRERGGPSAARADLFNGRPWIITPTSENTAEQIAIIEALALDLGAVPVISNSVSHDRAVALVSHLPQLVSSITAARLSGALPEDISLAGQGLRDITRLAASDSDLWLQIVTANASEITGPLAEVAKDIQNLVDALENLGRYGSRRTIAGVLAAGQEGVALIPGKHGTSSKFKNLTVIVPDTPGELARLLTEVGSAGINLEDLRLEHSPSAQVGLAEISVKPDALERLLKLLAENGWRIAG